MPKILFASNSVSHFPGSIIGTDSWSFDSNRVPYSIRCPLATIASSPNFTPTTTDETWVHFRFGSNLWFVNNDEPIVEIVDISGNRILQLSMFNKAAEGYHLRYSINGTSNTISRAVPILASSLTTCDIKVGLSSVNASIEVFINEMRIFDVSFAISDHEKPRAIWLGGSYGSGGSGQINYSEIIVADADTRNARLDLLRPVSAGAYGQWNGPLSSLSDDDPTTGMTTTVADQKQSTVLTPYTGANNISNIVQVTTSVRGLNSPTKLQHLLRMSAVDYFTSSFDVPYAKDFQVTDWQLNPATSLPWVAADLVGTEFGFKSVA